MLFLEKRICSFLAFKIVKIKDKDFNLSHISSFKTLDYAGKKPNLIQAVKEGIAS